MIFTILRAVYKNLKNFFIFNNFKFSREFNIEIEKQLIFYIMILTSQERINGASFVLFCLCT